jgi:hypothetical protein
MNQPSVNDLQAELRVIRQRLMEIEAKQEDSKPTTTSVLRKALSKGFVARWSALVALAVLFMSSLVSGDSQDALFIDKHGNVTIGTSNSSATVDVRGTVKAHQNVDVQGDVNATGTLKAKKLKGDGTDLTVEGKPLKKALAEKFNKSGGTISGPITITGPIHLGGDMYACEKNKAGTLQYNDRGLTMCDGNAWVPVVLALSPGAVKGLQLWVHGDAGVKTDSGEITPGSQVEQWEDQSGQGNHFSQQEAGRRPTVSKNALKGHVVLSMKAAARQTMTISYDFGKPFTVIYVARMTGGTSGRILSGLKNNWLLGWHAGQEDRFFFGTWIYEPTRPVTTDWRIYAAVGTGNYCTVFRDGQVITLREGSVDGPNGLSLSGHNAKSEFSDCEVAEIMVFNRALGPFERSRLEYYLAAKYGI